MDQPRFRALLIDIDDTIVRLKPGASHVLPDHHSNGASQTEWTSSLLDVLQAAGVELGGLTPEETARRIAKTRAEIRWWHISDFIVALGLNPKRFWRFAYDRERRYLEPTGPEIRPALQRLHAAGVLLYIASNNSSSGILHKLHLAGVATINGTTLFSQLLGADALCAMKWEPIFWRKALAHIALDSSEVAVVGDNPRDDAEVPRQVGIAHSFLIDRSRDRSSENTEGITYVSDFAAIADSLLGVSKMRRRPARA